uniref:serine C-palmitoyltransferase n=1 Tax=Odontella aurita TaxID=265563 RepID=A0A7S4K9G5_9STRA|mmetsp:Transcript_6890/g.20643  ORF Transcript_6890/g.20643 Transcript_6890/m.20643 type:complete len:718 (+) Transcript_6890:471-2624(+)
MVNTRSGRKAARPQSAPQSQPSVSNGGGSSGGGGGGGPAGALSKKLSGLRGRSIFGGGGGGGSKGGSGKQGQIEDHDDLMPDLTPSSAGSRTSSSTSSVLPQVVSESDGSSSQTSSTCGDAHLDEDVMLPSSGRGAVALHWKFYDGGEDDPYADMRERMERLSREDREEHVLHCPPASATEEGEDEDPSRACSHGKGRCRHVVDESTIPFFAAVTTYLGYAVLIVVGHFRDICANIFRSGRYLRASHKSEFPSDDLRLNAPLLKSWENFYTRRLYHRIQDCFNRPISSRPGAVIDVLERVSADGNKTMQVLGRGTDERREEYSAGAHYVEAAPGGRVARRCLNLGSYNYLGFADDWDSTCREGVLGSLRSLPVSSSSARLEFGTTSLHDRVERVVATFVGKEAAVVLNMGFNTNATAIPALATKHDLLVSDELNHTSIVNGARASGASIRTFRHNDSAHLEEILRTAIVMGRPRTRRPWNRILVVVEGVYSMEGEYCDLPSIVRVCKRYGAYVYLDEAHSIGAMGPTGRGCCEYTGVDPADVDIMMGTFTKSFGGMGGYVAGSKEVVDYLRERCAGSSYHNSLSPVVCQQIISSFEVIMGHDGTTTGQRKLSSLRDNSNYFRMRLTDMGLHVLGNYDSPIMPVMLYNPTKIAAFSRECLKRGLAVVVVGFPAVPVLMSRARFCISAGHTREELDVALREIDEIADLLKLRYARSTFG